MINFNMEGWIKVTGNKQCDEIRIVQSASELPSFCEVNV